MGLSLMWIEFRHYAKNAKQVHERMLQDRVRNSNLDLFKKATPKVNKNQLRPR